MTKDDAIRLLGGTASSAAKAIGVSTQAIHVWPKGVLPARIRDRVQAAIARSVLPPQMLGEAEQRGADSKPKKQRAEASDARDGQSDRRELEPERRIAQRRSWDRGHVERRSSERAEG